MDTQIKINGREVEITMSAELIEIIESEANKIGMTVEEYLASGAMEKMGELFPGCTVAFFATVR